MRILVVEDDQAIAELVRKALQSQGDSVDVAGDGEQAWLLIGTENYDLLILDITLPRRSGLDLLKDLRGRGLAVPVIILSARDGINDKIAGLDLGADDYLTKPFATSELLARVRALGRRKSDLDTPVMSCSGLDMDLRDHRVTRNGRLLDLTAKEFALLRYLLERQGHVVTHTDILEKVWDVNFDMYSDVLKVVISRLRKKLEAQGEPSLIHTIRGVGYLLKEADNDL
ncbi:MAG: response regulator transcription factor [Phycisphaeraceae bacterium]|nr:response regulator transcription factor [Phycisphaeraceae bacterium]